MDETMDETTTAREAVIDLLREWREARQREEGQACAERELLLALAALDRAERPRAVPTEPGAYYLEDGAPTVCRKELCLLAPLPDGDWEYADILTWATDPTTGEVERVPSLEEWADARSNLSHAEARRDHWRDRAQELAAERDALTAKGEEAARLLIEAQQQAQRAEDTVERAHGLAAQLHHDMHKDHDPDVHEYARSLAEVIDVLFHLLDPAIPCPAFRRREVSRG